MTEEERLIVLNQIQDEGVNAWKKTGKGVLEWFTGVGKTWGFYKCYLKIKAKNPSAIINVVVPTRNLLDDWERVKPIKDSSGKIIKDVGHIKRWNLQNVKVYVLNGYVTKHQFCHVLVVDEIHHILGKDSMLFNKCIDVTSHDFFLGLSATLTKEEKEFLASKKIEVVHSISKQKAKDLGLVAKTIEFNVAIKLTPTEQEEYDKYSLQHDRNQRFFVLDDEFRFDIANKAIKNIKLCNKIAAHRGWGESMGYDHEDSPTNIKKAAFMWHQGMSKRKAIVNKAANKIKAILYLVEKFDKSKTITFSENNDFVDAITRAINTHFGHPYPARSYHSSLTGEIRHIGGISTKIGKDRLKKETLMLFYSEKVRILNTAKSLDEGADIPAIELAIVSSGSGKVRQQTQREGRAIRFVFGKTAMIVNLYIPNTQDEVWLKSRQISNTVYWVDSVEQVDYDYVPSEPNLNSPPRKFNFRKI